MQALSLGLGVATWGAALAMLPAAAHAEAGGPMARSGLLSFLQNELSRLSATLGPIVKALPTIPEQLSSAWRVLGEDQYQSLASGATAIVGVVLAMAVVAHFGRTAARAWLRPDAVGHPAAAVSRRFLVDVAGFLAAAVIAILGAEVAAGGPGLVAKLAQASIDLALLLMAALLVPAILFRPGEPELRLVEATEEPITRATPWARATLLAGLAFPTLVPVMLDAGMAWPAAQGLALFIGLTVSALGAMTGLRYVSASPSFSRRRGWIAGLATAFGLIWSYGVITLDFPFYFLMFRLGAVLTAGFILDRLVAHASRVSALPVESEVAAIETGANEAADRTGGEPAGSVWRNFGEPLRRVIRVATASMALFIIALWAGEVAPSWLEGSTLPSLRASLAGALLTLNLGFAVFCGLSAWTRSRYSAQSASRHPGGDDDVIAPASRLATVIPVIQGLIGAIVLGVSMLSALSQLGVNITPILAGAGILGLAISFGSQSLVRDVVAGMFYMIDDAFRLGEYIEAGRLKGSVERISVRSVQMRHHNGQLHTVPYGQLGSITNYSRDWITLKFNLRLSRDIDIDAVRKIVKAIGLEMLEDPEIGKEFILPLKMQGVADILENALLVRFKFTARPGKPTYLQREAIKRIFKVFNAQGITFAQNSVFVENATDRQASEAATAATAVALQAQGAA